MLSRPTSVLVVDMQNDYCVPGGIIHALGHDVAHFAAVAGRLDTFLRRSRPWLEHRVFIRTLAPTWPRSTAVREQYGRNALQRVVDPTLSDWFGVTPAPDDPVVEKFRYSAFTDTVLDAMLRARGTQTVVVAGVTTDVCVDSTVRSAFMRDYGVVVLSDCTGASTPDRHAHTLSVLNEFFAVAATSEDVMQCLPAG